MSTTTLKMEETANVDALRVPARGFWRRLCDMVGKVGLPPYMQNTNADDNIIRKLRPGNFPLNSTLSGGITKTLIGSHVQLNRFVPQEIMRDLPIAVPWKLLEIAHMPSLLTGLTAAEGPAKMRAPQGRSPIVANVNRSQGRVQNNCVESEDIIEISLTALRSPSQADLIFGPGTTSRNNTTNFERHINPTPVGGMRTSGCAESAVSQAESKTFADATAQTGTSTQDKTMLIGKPKIGEVMTQTSSGNTSVIITTISEPEISNIATQVSMTATANLAIQTIQPNTADNTTQNNMPTTADGSTHINKPTTADVMTHMATANVADATTQISIPSTADVMTQISKPTATDVSTQMNRPTVNDATPQVYTHACSVANQSSPQNFADALVQAATSTASAGTMCYPEKTHIMTQADPNPRSPADWLGKPLQDIHANLISDFVINLVNKYRSFLKTELHSAMRESEIRTEVGQFLTRLRGNNSPVNESADSGSLINEIPSDSDNENSTNDEINVPSRSLSTSEKESDRTDTLCEISTQETAGKKVSDITGFVDLRMSRSEPILTGHPSESFTDFEDFWQGSTRSLPSNELHYLTSLDTYIDHITGLDLASITSTACRYSSSDRYLDNFGHKDGRALCTSQSEPHVAKVARPVDATVPERPAGSGWSAPQYAEGRVRQFPCVRLRQGRLATSGEPGQEVIRAKSDNGPRDIMHLSRSEPALNIQEKPCMSVNSPPNRVRSLDVHATKSERQYLKEVATANPIIVSLPELSNVFMPPQEHNSLSETKLLKTDGHSFLEGVGHTQQKTEPNAADPVSGQVISVKRRDLNTSQKEQHVSWQLPDVFVPIVETNSIEWVLKDDGLSKWVLGKGCYGSVLWAKYKREDGSTTNVAIKVMKDPSCADTIVREAKILMYLQDTGVFPDFYGYVNIGTGDELNVCLVQKMFGDGRTIAHLLIDDNELDHSEWMRICLQLANGLKKIHEKEVILNDLKENNVLINDSVVGQPVIKFIDVGVSTYTHGVSYKLTEEERKNLTHIAPEVKNNMASSYLSDIYGLGTIYENISKKVDILGLADVAAVCTKEVPEERLPVDIIIECLSAMRRALCLT